MSAGKGKAAPSVADAAVEPAEDPDADTEGAEDIISVYGTTAQRCTTLGSVTLSLVVGTGERSDGGMVLVPYVECELVEDTPEPQPLEWTLTLDNVAFLVEEFATDLAALVPPLIDMASGELKPARERIEYAVQCIARANSQLATAGDGLRSLLTAS